MNTWKAGTTILATLLLTACGGGGSSAAPPPPVGNLAPTADAGTDQSVDEGAMVQLAGRGTDPEGATLTYAWSQVSGPAVTLADPADPDTTVMTPEVSVASTEPAVLELLVTDDQGARATDRVSIAITSTDFVWYIQSELYKYDPETDTTISLSGAMASGGNVAYAVLSPDGQWFAYVADQDTDDVFELYVVSIDGGGVTKVSTTLPAFADLTTRVEWSPDSAQLVYLADAEQDDVLEVYLVDRDGANSAKINGGVGQPATVDLESARWSPDGRYIAQTVRRLSSDKVFGINVYDTTNPGSVRITNLASDRSINLFTMQWSPDSTRLAYETRSDDNRTNEVYIARADGSDNSAVVAPGTDPQAFRFAWSPDGSKLAFNARETLSGAPMELFVVNADNTGTTRINPPLPAGISLTSTRARWSPDGRLIAYLTEQFTNGGIVDLYTARPDGSSVTKVTPQPMSFGGLIVNYRWSPDGNWLGFTDTIDTEQAMGAFVVRPDGSEFLKVNSDLVAGGNVRFTNWSPDSTRLAYNADQETDETVELYSVRTDGSERYKVNAALNNASVLFSSWSADSSRLLYAPRDTTNFRITSVAIATPDGMDQRTIVTGPVSRFAWSN